MHNLDEATGNGQIQRLTTNSSQTSPLNQSDKDRARTEWFTRLLVKLNNLRGLQLEPNRAEAILEELHYREYPHHISKKAELVLLYKDFTFRGANVIIDIADFYPDDEQIKAAEAKQKGGEYFVITKHDLENIRAVAYDKGFRRGKIEAKIDPQHLQDVDQSQNYGYQIPPTPYELEQVALEMIKVEQKKGITFEGLPWLDNFRSRITSV